MKWNAHVKKAVAKGNQMLGVLRRNLKHCPRNLRDLAYKSILRPKLEYACSVWDPYTAENINIYLRGYRDAQLDLFATNIAGIRECYLCWMT